MLFLTGLAVSLLMVGLYAWLTQPASLAQTPVPAAQGALNYVDFETEAVLASWARSEDSSPNAEFSIAGPGFTGERSFSVTTPISATETYDFHLIQTMPRKFKATAIVARVRWPDDLNGVRMAFAVLCVRPTGMPYHCEGLPVIGNGWQTFVFNLRNGGESKSDVSGLDLEGLALLGKFEKTSPAAPLTVTLLLDDLEIWAEPPGRP
ncbi:MAG: hypothetical protein OHK0015_08340 [Chloroflexi bacterium OHK40]